MHRLPWSFSLTIYLKVGEMEEIRDPNTIFTKKERGTRYGGKAEAEMVRSSHKAMARGGTTG
ncbi:hypothetical protein DAMNIGENAA_10630 [Desulforhabdus amnigena]|uniref:Uncharacterized protein n=1 Tax=Desulforhabdus amnigena TaxID=40218 RepID=A0A9W6D0I5_9BACT|nr:hypothetical protein DAMNIGENAA_10630 [Desulforhabdus amnigena]